jgi:hypothetical protein
VNRAKMKPIVRHFATCYFWGGRLGKQVSRPRNREPKTPDFECFTAGYLSQKERCPFWIIPACAVYGHLHCTLSSSKAQMSRKRKTEEINLTYSQHSDF